MKNIIKYSFIVLCSSLILASCGNDAPEVKETVEPITKAKVEDKKEPAEPIAKATTVSTKEKQLIEVDVSDQIVEDKKKVTSTTTKKSTKTEKAKETTTSSTSKKAATKKSSSKRAAAMTFVNKVHEYGMIHQGDKVEHKFKFKNTGQSELQILNVTASCGCTQPSYSFMPIAPGEEGEIGVHFDSAGKLGPQKPTITVVTNASPKIYKLRLDGFVNSPKKEEPAEAKQPEEGQE